MRKAFRDAYERELSVLYERAAEFAAEYPGVAGRLGGLLRENTDPAVAGMLEGAAFMAARVQLKLDEEFRSFTTELLDQIFPDALAPLPAMMLVEANLPDDCSDLAEGKTFPAGSYLDARFLDSDQRVSCRFRLGAPLQLWPVSLSAATYLSSPAEVSALGQDSASGTLAGLQITLDHALREQAASFSTLPMEEMTFTFTGALADAVALYEQVHCNAVRVSLRYLDRSGDPAFVRLRLEAIEQIGFGRDERLLPQDQRLFEGFGLLREAFAFPRKFLGFRLTGLRAALRAVRSSQVQLVLEFDKLNASLAARLRTSDIRLHVATAVNLFEEAASQVRLDTKRHEFVVTPASSPVTHYEVHRVLDVYAHYGTSKTKVPVFPLYGLPDDAVNPRQALYYTSRRKERRLTEDELRFGKRHRYLGTETYISIYEPPEAANGSEGAQRLQIRTLCSNRHLPEYLPIAGSKDDFHMTEDVSVTLGCVAGPTAPREPLSLLDMQAPHRAVQGDVYWRLLSYLALSHFGLSDRDAKNSAASLRELLSLFADMSEATSERHIRGIEKLATRPLTRLIRREDGHYPARGVEVQLTFDEEAYEGSGIMLMGAILDRFLAEYAAVNSFTQVVIVSRQRGVLKTWPPRTGSGPLI